MNSSNNQENAMNAVLKATVETTQAQPRVTLQRWYLALDGNQHRSDFQEQLPLDGTLLLSEAMLPQIRMLACLSAAQRCDWTTRSPEVFTDEADWFAARILVLGVKVFHLDVTLIPMLKTANARAARLAAKLGLPFEAAQMRMSLHAARPHGGLIIENTHFADDDLGMMGNTLQLRERLQNVSALMADAE